MLSLESRDSLLWAEECSRSLQSHLLLVCVCLLSCFSCIWLHVTLWTVAHQAPLSIVFSMQDTRVCCHALLQGSTWPRNRTYVSYISCIGRQVHLPLAPPGKAIFLTWYKIPTNIVHAPVTSINMYLFNWFACFPLGRYAYVCIYVNADFPGDSSGKEAPANAGAVGNIPSLGWEDALEKEIATYSSILAWTIPRTEESGGLQSIRSQGIRQSWSTWAYTQFIGLQRVWHDWAHRLQAA